MVAEREKVIRTERLELVGPDGDVQAVLEATHEGPRVDLRGDLAQVVLRSANGRPRLTMQSRKDGARVAMYSSEAEGLDPLAYLDTDGHQASFALYTVRDDGLTEPRVMATSRRQRGSTEPRLCVYDEDLNILLEVPRTGETLSDRLTGRLARALEEELATGAWGGLTACEIEEALHLAADNSGMRDAVERLTSSGRHADCVESPPGA